MSFSLIAEQSRLFNQAGRTMYFSGAGFEGLSGRTSYIPIDTPEPPLGTTRGLFEPSLVALS